jgi:hypothetical protein
MSGDIQTPDHLVARSRIVINMEDFSKIAPHGPSVVSISALVPGPIDETRFLV